ncbi:hypothetical protein DFQ28_004125 [Apophysomyces sp. BC1034]|nr:hypothetical protein DFQ28_004125 [Apophysomyces sp. BC1034]
MTESYRARDYSGPSDRRDNFRSDDRRSDRRDERHASRPERGDARDLIRKDQGDSRELGRRELRDDREFRRERNDPIQTRRREERNSDWSDKREERRFGRMDRRDGRNVAETEREAVRTESREERNAGRREERGSTQMERRRELDRADRREYQGSSRSGERERSLSRKRDDKDVSYADGKSNRYLTRDDRNNDRYTSRTDRRDEKESIPMETNSRQVEREPNLSERGSRRAEKGSSQSEREPSRQEMESSRYEREPSRQERESSRQERESSRYEKVSRQVEREPSIPERISRQAERDASRPERDSSRQERGSRRMERDTSRSEREVNRVEKESRLPERESSRTRQPERNEHKKREREENFERIALERNKDTVLEDIIVEDIEEPQSKKQKTEDEEITTTDGNVAKELQLSNFRISRSTIECLAKRGISSLFEIQSATFDAIYDGEDVLARARTGTGKTLAFSLPVIEKLSLDKELGDVYGRAPRVLVLCPTRDLAKQVCGDFESVSGKRLKSLPVYGGVPYPEQTNVLRSGVDVIVGTPGRVLDHIKAGQLRLNNLRYIILDEADEMLDARGFEEDMFNVLEFVKEQKTSRDYQMLLFSATVPESVMETIKRFVKQDYKRIDLIGDAKNRTNQNIRHIAMPSSIMARASVIGDVVNVYGKRGLSVIFCATKADANELSTYERIKQDAAVLHGDIAQQSREATMKAFREGKYRCIVCTDVLARGLDIPQVDLVINCQPPKDTESYVHRSGRTGRAGRRTGVQFETMSAPRAEDVIKATTEDAFKSIDLVKPEVLPFFVESARLLINKHGAEEAVASALAFMTGYHQGVPSRSLLSSMEGHTTIYFKFAYTIQSPGYARTLLSNEFPKLVHEDCTSWRMTKDMMGVVVDVVSDKVESKDNVIYLAGMSWTDRADVTLEIPNQLPALAEPRGYFGGRDRMGGYGHRNGGFGGGNRYGGGGGGYNGRPSSFFNRGGRR